MAEILYKDENTGAMDLAFDPSNAQIIYADMWSARQVPWEGSLEARRWAFQEIPGDGGGEPLRRRVSRRTSRGSGESHRRAKRRESDLCEHVDAGRLGGIYRSDDARAGNA